MKKTQYDFGLVIGGVSELSDEITDALYEAGCDDATFSIRQGTLYGEFSREAKSLKDALLSAIRDIRSAKIGAIIWRVDEGELVSPSEIGRKIGKSRQVVFNYINGLRGPGEFPPPEYRLRAGDPLWAWSTVSAWMAQHNLMPPEEQSNAEVIAMVNNSLETVRRKKQNPKLFSEVAAKVCR